MTSLNSPERFARIKSSVLVALDLDVAERAPYLEEACSGDPELRGDVETMKPTPVGPFMEKDRLPEGAGSER